MSASAAPLRLPAGSCDCHFHVFDAARWSYATHRHYTPPDAVLADYLALAARFGVDRGVLVHPTVFGSDHRSFEEILRQHPGRLRGVAVVAPHTPDEDIARWHRLGARGTRVTTVFAGGPDLQVIRRIAAKVRPFGWHLQLLVDLVAQPDLVARVRELGIEVVVDHMGHHSAPELARSEGFANLRAQLAEGGTWVKLSAPYRLSAHSAGDPAIQHLVEVMAAANPAQLLWGTDWPHPSSPHAVPDDATLVLQIFEWLPDPDLRTQVLVDNPTRLYWKT